MNDRKCFHMNDTEVHKSSSDQESLQTIYMYTDLVTFFFFFYILMGFYMLLTQDNVNHVTKKMILREF